MLCFYLFFFFFFFNDTATTEIYTLSLHDALPIFSLAVSRAKELGVKKVAIPSAGNAGGSLSAYAARAGIDRKSTRLNSSHSQISYAVFCLKKKKKYQDVKSESTIMITGCSHLRCR